MVPNTRNIHTINDQNFATRTKSPDELIVYAILRLRNECIQAIRKNRLYSIAGAGKYPLKREVVSTIQAFFDTISYAYEQDMQAKEKTESIKLFKEARTSNKPDIVVEAFYETEGWLYKKGITQFDKIVNFDTTDPELDNEMAGL